MAQAEKSHWRFGYTAGIDFSSGSPQAVYSSAMTSSFEATVTMADAQGNLLFYSEGSTVWNAVNSVMDNGTGLMGGTSTSQSISIPKPGDPNIYYLFTVGQENDTVGLRFSEIDMSANNGLGQVTANKNVVMDTAMMEKLTAVKHCNGVDFWLVAHRSFTNQYHAYLVSSSGINTTAVVSTTGTTPSSLDFGGEMVFANSGDRIANPFYDSDRVDVSEFDRNTGVVSNTMTLLCTNFSPYSLAFSPDDSRLYFSITNGWEIHQFNMLAGNASNIQNSRTLVGTGDVFSQITQYLGQIELANDGKLYIAKFNKKSLARINNPNALGTSCGFELNAFSVTDNITPEPISKWGLPNFPMAAAGYGQAAVIENNVACIGDSVLFWVNTDYCEIDSVFWNFGDSASGAQNYSDSLEPQHLFTDTGTFNVVLHVFANQGYVVDTIVKQVVIGSEPYIDSLGTVTLCAGDTLFPSIQPDVGLSYLWSDATTAPYFIPSVSGNYWLQATNVCGATLDSFTVELTPTSIDLGPDTLQCNGTDVTLTDSMFSGTILWSDNTTDSQLIVQSTGSYWVQGTNSCGVFSDTVNVTFTGPPTFPFPQDTTLCDTGSLIVSVVGQGLSVLWNTGATDSSLHISQNGLYSVTASNPCGMFEDSVDVFFHSDVPSIDLGPDTTICVDETIALNAGVGGQGETYTWQDGSQDSLYSVASQGLYWVIVSNLCGAETDSLQVTTQDYLPQEFLKDTALCMDDVIILDPGLPATASLTWNDGSTAATLTVNDSGAYYLTASNVCGTVSDTSHVIGLAVPGSALPEDTLWCGSDILSLDVSCYLCTHLWNDGSVEGVRVIDEVGNYTLETVNPCGTYSDSMLVRYVNFPTADIGPDLQACAGEEVVISTALEAGDQAFWSTGETGAELGVVASGTYSVEVKNECGVAHDTLLAEFDGEGFELGPDTSICHGEIRSLSVNVESVEAYSWNNGSDANTIRVVHPGTYWLSLETKGGCLLQDSITFVADECPDFVVVPNVFTPNGDHSNDRLKIAVYGVHEGYQGMIYNRWGKQVYAFDEASEFWNGETGLGAAPEGVYYWIIEVNYPKSQYKIQGSFSLLRQ